MPLANWILSRYPVFTLAPLTFSILDSVFSMLDSVVKSGNIDALRELVTFSGMKLVPSHLTATVSSGNVQMLLYVQRQLSCESVAETRDLLLPFAYFAACGTNLRMVQFLSETLEIEAKDHTQSALAAVMYDKFEILQYLHKKQGQCLTNRLLLMALGRCNMKIVRWLLEKQVVYQFDAAYFGETVAELLSMSKSRTEEALEALLFLIEQDRTHLIPEVKHIQSKHALYQPFLRVPILKLFKSIGISPTEDSILRAIVSDSFYALETVRYLFEDPTSEITLLAIRADVTAGMIRKDVLTYLRENGGFSI